MIISTVIFLITDEVDTDVSVICIHIYNMRCRREGCRRTSRDAGCCGNLKLMFYVNYAAWDNVFGQFLGVFEANNYDRTNDKPKKIF